MYLILYFNLLNKLLEVELTFIPSCVTNIESETPAIYFTYLSIMTLVSN